MINAILTRGAEHGKFIWEAKYHIINENDFVDAFDQAKSYAFRLTANGLGLVSSEGIWVSLAKDSYQRDKVINYSWHELEDKDTFQRVSDILKKSFGKL